MQLDPTAIGVNRPIDVPLVGDLRGDRSAAGRGAEGLPSALHRAELAGWIKKDADTLTELATDRSFRQDARCIRRDWWSRRPRRFPKNGIMVRDGGATVIFQWTYSQAKPHDVIWNQNFGHLGTGLPYAIGASVAEGGKRPVMLLTSDSSFLFHISELETAARLKLPLVCVVGRRLPVGPRGGRLQAHLRQRIG